MWQAEFPKRWFDIDKDAQIVIEAAYQRFLEGSKKTVHFSVCCSQRKDLWRRYIIDFGTMEQTNIDSDRVRQVRRIE